MDKYTNFKNTLVKWEKIFSNEGNLIRQIYFRTQSEDSRMAFYSFCQWLDNRQPDLTAHYTKIKNNPLYYHRQDCMYGRRFKRKDELQCIEEGKSWNKKKVLNNSLMNAKCRFMTLWLILTYLPEFNTRFKNGNSFEK